MGDTTLQSPDRHSARRPPLVAGAGRVRRRRRREALGQVAADHCRSRRCTRRCADSCALLGDARLRAARARDDRRGDARAGRASAYRARAPLCRQAAARSASASSTPPSRRSRCGRALWEQYSACLKPLLEGDIELQGVKAKLLQRGLYVGKQLVHRARPRAPRCRRPTLWQELHAYYRLAEMLDCAVTAVSDDLMPHAVGISCYSTYCHALLLGLADPCAMSRPADRARRPLARPVGAQGLPVRAAARDRRSGDPRRPRRHGRRAGSPPRRRATRRASMRFGYPGQARDQRARAPEAPRGGRDARRAAARPRHVGRAVRRAARAPRRALVPAAAARRATRRTTAHRSHAPAACRPRTSASAAARSTARIRSAA